MYSNGIWQALLTTRRGSCGRQTTKNIAKGLKSMQAPSHTISNHVGKNASCSNIISELSVKLYPIHNATVQTREVRVSIADACALAELLLSRSRALRTPPRTKHTAVVRIRNNYSISCSRRTAPRYLYVSTTLRPILLIFTSPDP